MKLTEPYLGSVQLLDDRVTLGNNQLAFLECNLQKLLKGFLGPLWIREVVCNKVTEAFFERLYDNRKEELNAHPSPDTFVFCHQDGTPIKTMRKAFDSLLDDLVGTASGPGRHMSSRGR